MCVAVREEVAVKLGELDELGVVLGVPDADALDDAVLLELAVTLGVPDMEPLEDPEDVPLEEEDPEADDDTV